MHLNAIAMAVFLSVASGHVAADQMMDHSHHHAAAPEQQPWGIAGDAAAVSRSIEISMDDNMRFSPELIEVQQGETIRFVLPNKGAVQHEFVLGEKAGLDEYANMVLQGMGMQHGQTGMSHVDPGQAGEVLWTFNRAGTFDFACLIAGHYQSGMIGKIKVNPR